MAGRGSAPRHPRPRSSGPGPAAPRSADAPEHRLRRRSRRGPQFVLVSAGAVIRPKVPTDQCGQPQAAALSALRALPWRLTHRVLLRQVASPAELASGCPPAYKDLFDLDAANFVPAKTVPPSPREQGPLTVCAYRDTDAGLNHADGTNVSGADIEVAPSPAGPASGAGRPPPCSSVSAAVGPPRPARRPIPASRLYPVPAPAPTCSSSWVAAIGSSAPRSSRPGIQTPRALTPRRRLSARRPRWKRSARPPRRSWPGSGRSPPSPSEADLRSRKWHR